MNFLGSHIFRILITFLVLYGPEMLSNLGVPILGIIISTFPVGILSLLNLKNISSLDILINQTIISNIIIILPWVIIYLNSKPNNINYLSIIGLVAWFVISIIYYVYLLYVKN